MKWFFKSKSFIAVSVILLAFIQDTEAAFERREDRLKIPKRISNDTYNPNDTGTEVGNDLPIEDNIPLFLGLAFVYGLSVFKKKKRMK